MLKTPSKLKKMLILPCMCSITFYLGSQMMTYTEAAFVHETKVQATVSTAIIFPKTVDQLTEQAKQHKQVILHEYEEMKAKLTVTSTQELEVALVVWKQGREKIAAERELLQQVYTTIATPYNQVQEELKANKSESTKQIFSYVNAGFHIIKEDCKYVDKEVSLQEIDKQIQAFEKVLVDEATKKVNEEQKKLEEAKQLEENKKQEEARKLEESKKQEEAKQLEENKKQEEAKKLEESKKQEEVKKLEESKKQEEVKKLEESKKQKEVQKPEENKYDQKTNG